MIHYPSEPSEFEIQAYLYSELRKIGLDVRGEVHGQYSGQRHRFDLVVFVDPLNPIRIIEVKKHRKRDIRKPDALGRLTRGRNLQKQIMRYERSGVPVDVVGSMKNAIGYVNAVRSHGGIRYYTLKGELIVQRS